MTVACWTNGKPGTRIEADDRGLQYGDGVFETLAVKDGRIVLLEFHQQRLMQGCERLRIPPPSLDVMQNELISAARGQQRAVLKLIVTRGSGGRGYRPPQNVHPTRILSRHAWPAYPESWQRDGISVRMCRTLLGGNPQLAGLKHLNRIEQVLARAEWSDADGIQEGLMTDAGGAVIEGTMSNVFVRLADGKWVTPGLEMCGVAGVMRRYILERAAAAGVVIETGKLTISDLHAAAEIFVCNSIIGVWPVSQFEERSYTVGEMTRRVQDWVREA